MDRNQMTTRILIFTAVVIALIATLAVSCAPAATEPAPTNSGNSTVPGTYIGYKRVSEDGVDCIVFYTKTTSSLYASCDWK